MYLFGLQTPNIFAANLFVGGKNYSQKSEGGKIEMDNIYPCVNPKEKIILIKINWKNELPLTVIMF